MKSRSWSKGRDRSRDERDDRPRKKNKIREESDSSPWQKGNHVIWSDTDADDLDYVPDYENS